MELTWHVNSRGMFAGTCIGVFFWVLAYLWFHRMIVEYDRAIVEYKLAQYAQTHSDACCCCENGAGESTDITEKAASSSDSSDAIYSVTDSKVSQFFRPIARVLKHRWLVNHSHSDKDGSILVYPSPLEHLFKSVLYMMEWACSFLIMLMWMYYNGYVVITCILGYFFGQLLFSYAPLTVIGNKKYLPPKEEKTHC
ncbi:hypothetical protein FOA43_000139 [Brettanomyces nanus]|uniref:Copper transport protein n=1 Tax=Eeniella nana TaxID=13502 RepID=A0A875RST0_EENNA|nr:uncharacterized protein FOA43_000139 [Brettanomyces nanus]QPG72837.1 hypothetical protein FOA43_000139 [Brettanomyces nanus]